MRVRFLILLDCNSVLMLDKFSIKAVQISVLKIAAISSRSDESSLALKCCEKLAVASSSFGVTTGEVAWWEVGRCGCALSLGFGGILVGQRLALCSSYDNVETQRTQKM